ncbi:MAG: S1C family serine protease [SAR324 cluster bacterium]|nr:S1C family serine protease [SAR324 cluster bacterium]
MKLLVPLLGIALLGLAGQSIAKPSVKEIVSSVVGVQAEIPANARTAHSLGTRRQGSGVIIDSNGLILTIGYLILEAVKIQVSEGDEQQIPAVFVGYDSESGFGVLRALKPLKGKAVEMGVSKALKRENPVLIVSDGRGGGLKSAMVISRRSFAGYWEYLLESAIFTTPPIQNFAGAALIDTNLKLVGIGSLFVGDAEAKGVRLPGNMFVPIDRLYPVLADLIALGRPSTPPKPWLGVYLSEVYGRVVVTRVAAASPASDKGMGEGDFILKVGGLDVTDMADFYRKLWKQGHAGVAVNLTILRGSEVKSLTLKSDDRYRHYKNLPVK